MPLHPSEEATLQAFVTAAKRERLIGLLGSRKRRKEALDTLNHFGDWDPRCIQQIPATCDVVDLLRRAGAPEQCHILSDDPALDGRDLPLAEAAAAAEDFAFATVLCCVPGKLACYFDEEAGTRRRLLLRRHD